MKKLLLISSIVMFVFALSSVCFAAGELTKLDTTAILEKLQDKLKLAGVEVTVPVPKAGQKGAGKDDIKFSDGVDYAGSTWVNAKTHTFMGSNETFEYGGEYTFNCFFDLQSNIDLGENFKVFLNGKEVSYTEVSKEKKEYKKPVGRDVCLCCGLGDRSAGIIFYL